MFNILKHKYLRAPHRVSFKHAWNGVVYAFDSQPNFRFHTLAFLAAIVAALYFKIDITSFLAILLTSSLVFVSEMVNTSLEALSDEVANGQYKELIKAAKDVSAGGVLVSVVFAVFTGVVVFGPRVFEALF